MGISIEGLISLILICQQHNILVSFWIVQSMYYQCIINSNMRKELSYQFDLDIQRVHLIINMKCDVQVWWKSGKRKIATKNSLKLTGNENYFDVREKLSIIAKIGYENGLLQEKKTELLIILFTSENTSKLGGRVYLNLAQFVSPDNLTATLVRKCERSLENCPDEASKIIFNLSCKYIEENVVGVGSENANDISFQANNFSSSVSHGSSFSRNIPDMTFRPEKEEAQKWQNQISGHQSSQGMRKNEHSPKERKKGDDREWSKDKIMDTPSWDRRQFEPPLPTQSGRTQKQVEKVQSFNHAPTNSQRPLEFSFNPMNAADRQKLGLDNTQIIKDLKETVEQRGQTIRSLQEQLSKLKIQFQQRSEKSSAKSISLLNELNSTNISKEQLQREKQELISQVQQLKEENKKLEQKCKSISFQCSDLNNQYMNKLEQRKKMIEDLNMKLEESDKRANKYQDELFKRENQMITKEKQFIASQINKQTLNKEQTEKLKSISAALKELQTNFEAVFAEKEDLKKRYNDACALLEKTEETNTRSSQNMIRFEMELQREKEKNKMIEGKYKERELIIQEIEGEFKKFSGQKMGSLKQKEDQISSMRDKLNSACKKVEDLTLAEESMKNTISQKNIRIKSLQEICGQLEKTLEEKEQVMGKAKEYVLSKQQEVEEKREEIRKRDEMIQKCRIYVETKEKQYNDLLNGTQTSSAETLNLKRELKEKEVMLQSYITERHEMEKKIQDMDRLIDRLKYQIGEYEDEVDELQRKHESQDGTLKELVKKNLDMEIQLNIKDYEIQALRSRK